MTATYEAIATTTLGSAQATVSFTSISGSFTDLVLVIAGGADGASAWGLRFNSDTGSNYSRTILTGDGSTASSVRDSNITAAELTFNGYLQNNTSYNAIAHIMNYSNSTTNKTILCRSNNAGTGTDAVVSLWRNTAAITRIDVITRSTNRVFNSGSTFTLYGIKAE